MVEVRKKPREAVHSLVRKFSSRIRLSGILKEAKKRQYCQVPLGKKERKEKALKKLKRANK